MSGIVLHTSTSATHAINLAESLSYQAYELPFKGESPPVLWGINVVVLMLEPNFLKKDVEEDPFFDEVLGKSTEDDFRLIPVLLAECAWEESNYNGLSFLPKNKVPVLSSPNVREHLLEMAQIARQVREIEDRIHLKKNNPIAYARQQKKQAKQEKGASFWMVAIRLGWKLSPTRIKWLLRLGLGAGIAAVTYLIFG